MKRVWIHESNRLLCALLCALLWLEAPFALAWAEEQPPAADTTAAVTAQATETPTTSPDATETPTVAPEAAVAPVTREAPDIPETEPSADTEPQPETDAPATDTPAPATDTPAPEREASTPEAEESNAPTEDVTEAAPETPSTETEAPASDAEPSATESDASPAVTASPTQTPTATPAPSATPTATLTATPSATPTVTPTPTPDPNARPTCDIPGCAHVTLDNNGNPVALCPLGEWMLAHGEVSTGVLGSATLRALMTGTERYAATLPAGTTTIYRSGTYVFSGGSGASTLVVGDHLAVALVLRDATLGELRLGNGASLQFGFTGYCAINRLTLSGGTLQLDGLGSLTVASVADSGTAWLTMGGGSLLLPAGTISRNNRACYDFYAPMTTAATVDGAYFSYTNPDGGGTAHLWLPAPDVGIAYRGSVVGTTLTVVSTAADPGTPVDFDMDGPSDLNALANQSYRVMSSGGLPQIHQLNVDQSGVILVLAGVKFPTTAQVRASRDARIHLGGDSELLSVDTDAALTLTGTGTLTVDQLTAATLYAANTARLCYGTASGTWNAAWQSFASPVDLGSVTRITYNGKDYAFAYCASKVDEGLAPLPTPDSGMRYEARQDGSALVLSQVAIGTQSLRLGAADLTLTVPGSYEITSEAGATGNLTVADGIAVSVRLRSVRTTGALSVGTASQVTLTLSGGCELDGGVTLGAAVAFAVQGAGALLAGGFTAPGSAAVTIGDATNLTLLSGSSLGDSSLKATVIHVANASGAPITNAAVTLKIGTGTPFRTTTAANGHVTLWRASTLTGASVVVLSQANTYADILTGDASNPNALPEISDVKVNVYSFITYTATNAQSSGIQYYLNRSGETMPDTYDPSAGQAMRIAGECNIPGLKTGDFVTFRVFAARGAGQSLTAETADAFQFSETYTFVANEPRKEYTIKEQYKEYNGSAFAFASGLIPDDAVVTFYHNGQEMTSAPVEVGQYVAAIVIPPGDPVYFPTAIAIYVNITRRVVWIYPEYASKIKGEEDPEVYYTYEGTLGDDEVTGNLFRVRGESYGNYPYETWPLVAADYYELKIDPDSPMFFIDWGPGHYIKVDPLSIIDPVHQLIRYTDGMELNLTLRTVEKLTIGKVTYGPILRDAEDGQTCPFTPELRLKHGYNQAMLIVQGEPELNDDGGYATDADGNVQIRARTLSLTAYHLNRLRGQRITTLGFKLQDALFVVDLADLTSDTVLAAMAEVGMKRSGTRYQITLDPVARAGDLADAPEAVQTAKALGAQMTRVKVQLQNGSQTLDIASLLPSARLMFDVSGLLAEAAQDNPAISEVTIGRQSADTSDDDALGTDVMELAQKIAGDKLKRLGTTLNYYADPVQTLDSRLVVPYTASEAETLPYTAVMKTSPYLTAHFHRNGLYGLSAPISE